MLKPGGWVWVWRRAGLMSCNVQTKNDETMEQVFINNMPKIPSKFSNQASIFRMPLNNNTGQTFFPNPFFIR